MQGAVAFQRICKRCCSFGANRVFVKAVNPETRTKNAHHRHSRLQKYMHRSESLDEMKIAQLHAKPMAMKVQLPLLSSLLRRK